MNVLLALLAAYLLGSFPTSYVAGKLAGIDLRQHGSKNLGATNVFRVLGWKYAVPVLLIDAAKGTAAAVLLGPWAGSQPWMPLMIGTAAAVGHVYTVFLSFKGGKGVATAAGVMVGIAPLAIGIVLGLWAVIVLLSGYVSLGSLLASAAFTPLALFLYPGNWYTASAGLALTGLIWYTHRVNIGRLMAGTEARFRRKGKTPA